MPQLSRDGVKALTDALNLDDGRRALLGNRWRRRNGGHVLGPVGRLFRLRAGRAKKWSFVEEKSK